MKNKIFEGKTYEEALEKSLDELQTTEENIITNILEEKNSLFSKNVKVEVYKYDDIISYLKEIINELTKLMNVDANLEVRRRNEVIKIKIFSEQNAILIGKNGKTLAAIQLIIRQIINEKLHNKVKILIDIENYQEKKEKHLTILAKNMAREVKETKVDVKLDSMNSYERRIIHEALANNKYVYTESVGEEPNRCVVIKAKEES